MSKKQANNSFSRHEQVDRFLRMNLPGCVIHYNGVEGIDHTIVFGDKTTYIETKTCDKIIRKKTRPELGRFRFKREKAYLYDVSQHDYLVKVGGWYIFVVASGNQYSEMTGCKACDVKLQDSQSEQNISWCTILNSCYPDWFRRLKLDVYNI